MDVPMFVLFGIDIIRFLIDLGTAYALFLAVSLTLNLEAGFAGVPNFGKVMFVAAGAVAAASVSGRFAAFILGVDTHGNFNVFIGGYEPLIGGTQGIQVPDLFAWAGNGIEVRDVVVLLFVVIFAGLVFLYVERVSRSPLGRTLRAVRDNEVA